MKVKSIDPLSLDMNVLMGPIIFGAVYGTDVSEEHYDKIAELCECTKEEAKLAVKFMALQFGIIVSDDGRKVHSIHDETKTKKDNGRKNNKEVKE